MSAGYVYVLSNALMPDVVKVGYSKNGGQSRSDIFYKNDTAVATPFELEFEMWVKDARSVESIVHKKLEGQRINPKREFFYCTPAEAKASILMADAHRGIAVLPIDISEGSAFQQASLFCDDVGMPEFVEACQSLVNNFDLVSAQIERRRNLMASIADGTWGAFNINKSATPL